MTLALIARWALKHWRPLAVVLLLAIVVWRIHAHGDAAGAARVQARWDAETAAEAIAAAKAAEAARKIEERHRADLAAAAKRFLADQRKADEDHERTLAALRAGTLRVRERFTCPAVPGAAADPGGADAEAGRGLGVEDAAAILGAAREGDAAIAQLNALIDALRREGR